MSRNGSGVYSVPNIFNPGDVIQSSDHNQNFDDLGDEITNSVAADGQTTMTGPLKAANGTAAAPSVTFGSDSDTGLFRKAGNTIGLACEGVEVGFIGTASAYFAGNLETGGALRIGGSFTASATASFLAVGTANFVATATFSLPIIASATATFAGQILASATATFTTAVRIAGNDPLALPRGYIDGFICSNAADAANDITVAAGTARDSTNTVNITLSSALTKQIDATWVAGTDQGGRSGASLANGTWHVFVIAKAGGASADVLFHNDVTPSLPTDYVYYRRVCSVVRSASAIRTFTQRGDFFRIGSPSLDVDVTTSTSSSTVTLSSIPSGIVVLALINTYATGSGDLTYVRSPNQVDAAPSATAAPLASLGFQGAALAVVSQIQVETNTSAQVSIRSVSGSNTLRMSPVGYWDMRGRE